MVSKTKSGFTLIELLVVISIIGVLATLVLVNYNAARARARDVRRKSDLDQIKKALRMYYNDQSPTVYPPTGGLPFGSVFQSTSGVVYMKIVPHDPLYDETTELPEYSYQQTLEGQDFCLWGSLENKSDSDIDRSKTRCATACNGITFDDDDYAVCAD